MSHLTHEESPRFHVDRPTDLRAPKPWNRLAYISGALEAAVSTLIQELDVPRDGSILDFGCADQPYRRRFEPTVRYVGADIPGNPLAELEVDEEGRVAAEDSSFDAVLSTQVLEHVSDPEVYLQECYRLLRPGGRLLLSTHGIMVYHPDPVDYWRWTCAGLQRVVEQAGFEVESFEGIMGLGATGLQLFQDAIYWRLPRWFRPPVALLAQALIRVVDRAQSAESRRMNALVFALVARKP